MKLGDVATIDRVIVEPSSMPRETAYLGLEHIERGGRIIGYGTVGNDHVTSSKFRFAPNHVLFGRLRPYLGKISRPDRSGVCSTDILPIRPGPKLDSGYLAHYLSQPEMIEFASLHSTGANLPRISTSSLSDFPVPLPAIEQQRQIARVLDHADVLRAQRQRVLLLHAELPAAVFREMFSEKVEPVPVAQLATAIRTGPFGSQLLHSEFVNEGVAVLGLDNVVDNEFTWAARRYITPEKYEKLRRYTVHPGDVLISIMGTTGRCVVVPEGIPTAINTKHICAITFDQRLALPEYVRAAFLWSQIVRRHLVRQTKGSIMDGLNMGIIKATPIPLPPMESQRVFVTRVQAVREQRAILARASSASEELFESLRFRAFRGEL